jgi:hypothetical protein
VLTSHFRLAGKACALVERELDALLALAPGGRRRSRMSLAARRWIENLRSISSARRRAYAATAAEGPIMIRFTEDPESAASLEKHKERRLKLVTEKEEIA